MVNDVILYFSILLSLHGISRKADLHQSASLTSSRTDTVLVASDSSALKHSNKIGIDRADLIAYAQTFKGTRYKYASADPKKGFDCSGFVMYVFNHFQMSVPRSSIDFTRVGNKVELPSAKPGDVILFTGANSKIRKVGHVGIITQAAGDSIVFIHASSGKKYSVTETKLNAHYKARFMKVVRLLE
jgi:cell wall-associated NlpC family hydrolase